MTDEDPAPLFVIPRAEPVEPEERDDLDPIPGPPEVKEPVDSFISEIDQIKRGVSPEVKDTIDRATCFGYGWYTDPAQFVEGDDDPGGPCLQTECDLRRFCELVYNRAGKVIEEAKEPEPEKTRTLVVRHKSRKKHGRPRIKEKIVPRGKWKGTGKYDRHPYVATGRPVDVLAAGMWEALGTPPVLPDWWMYPHSRTLQQREEAKETFKKNFGGGVVVTKRMQYHQYFLEGDHLMRYWVNAAGGGWLDLNPSLSRIILRHNSMDVEQTPESGRKTKYRFYPYRTFVGRRKHLNRLIEALADHKGIKIVSVTDEPGGEDENSQD